MTFHIDNRLSTTCILIKELSLSTLLLKNNQTYPWVILVPRVDEVHAMDMLNSAARQQLSDEIYHVSCVMRATFKPDTLNVASLCNIVSQLHIHIVARFKTDNLWPHSIWQEALETIPYTDRQLSGIIPTLQKALEHVFL